MTKTSRQKFKYLENQKIFQNEIKSICIILKERSLKQIKQNFFEDQIPTLSLFTLLNTGLLTQFCCY